MPRPLHFVAAVAISLLLHAALVVPLLGAVMKSSGAARDLEARFEPEQLLRQPPKPEPRLGIEEGDPSTVTWIGYREYQEHLARFAEFEQAAFTTTPGAAPAPPAPPAEIAPDEQSTDDAADGEAEAAAPTVAETQAAAAARAALAQLLERATQRLRQGAAAAANMAEALAAQQAAQDAPPSDSEETPPRPEQQPSRTGGGGGAPQSPTAEPAPPSDRDADATSSIKVPLDQLRSGRPVAAEGLELRPRKPDFTTLILLTAAPDDPLVEIRFGADGEPDHADILESSGDSRVDAFIRSSLYRWRASGKALDEFGEGETLNVRIRIVLR